MFDQHTFLTTADQIRLLRERGMEITDDARAEAALLRIGFHRLWAYFRSFIRYENTGETALCHQFKEGTSFSAVLDLYVFDKSLRLIVLDALERIEVSVRSDIANLLGDRHPLAYREASLLHGNFTRKHSTKPSKHEEWLKRLDERISKSKEDFVKPLSASSRKEIPIWMVVEIWDFGTLSHFFGGMRQQDKDRIASSYNLPAGEVLETWLRCLTDVRNICAHHSRLWNRRLVSQPRWALSRENAYLNDISPDSSDVSRTRIYAALLAMRIMLRTINPNSKWHKRLTDHLMNFPHNNHLSLRGAGFPIDWKDLNAWQ